MKNLMLIAVFAVPLLVPLVAVIAFRDRIHLDLQITDANGFLRELRGRVAEHMQANYNGDPGQLEAALRGVVPIVRRMATSHHLDLKEDLLRLLIVDAVSRAVAARRSQVDAAVRSVMEAQSAAA